MPENSKISLPAEFSDWAILTKKIEFPTSIKSRSQLTYHLIGEGVPTLQAIGDANNLWLLYMQWCIALSPVLSRYGFKRYLREIYQSSDARAKLSNVERATIDDILADDEFPSARGAGYDRIIGYLQSCDAEETVIDVVQKFWVLFKSGARIT